MNTIVVSEDVPYKSHYVDVYGSKIHYIEEGEGDPILFLHGIPASSYVWRNIFPYLTRLGRCIAPDLIGFGKSDKPHDVEYTAADHIRYIEKFIETLKLDRILLVMHGFGSIVGLDYAMRNSDKCKGLVFYEAYLRPMHHEDLSLPYQEQISKWKREEGIKKLVANSVDFVDAVLPQSVMRQLTEKELRYYREPFLGPGAARPLFQYLKDIPDENNEEGINKIIANYSKKLGRCILPKLMLYSVPGFLTSIATVMWAKKNIPYLEVIDVGEELHYAQESNPALMGRAISIWLQGVEQNL